MPDEREQPEPHYYMPPPGRRHKPTSLAEWNQQQRFLRFFAKEAGDTPPPPWLN